MKKPKRNWLDNTIAWISPQAGVKRDVARAKQMKLRFFDGADLGRRTDGWISTGSDANSEIALALPLLRNRSRDMVRNNPYQARAVAVQVANVIGAGIVGSPKNLQPQALAAWKKFSETTACDFSNAFTLYGLQQQSFRAIVESGGVLLKRVRMKPTRKNPLPFQLQVLEPDFIDYQKSAENIIQGIQFDNSGRIEGYWLFDKHPGSNSTNFNLKSNFVSIDDCRYIFRQDRPGQMHGVPWSAPVMIMMKDLDDLFDATLVKQKISAAFTAFVHDLESSADPLSGSQNDPILSDKFEPGVIEELPAGKTISFANPPSATDFPEFTKTILKASAAGQGITYEAYTGDLSGVNFSSGRMGWLEFQRLITQHQWNLFIPQWCGAVEDWLDEALTLAGYLSAQTDLVMEWTPPRREQIDPATETNAAIKAVRAGVKTLRQVHEENGDDHEEMLNQIEESNKLLDEKNLILDSDARRITISGQLQMGLNAGAIGESEGAETEEPAAAAPADTAESDDNEARYFESGDGALWRKTEAGKYEKIG